MAAVRRTNNDVKVEMEAATEDSNEAGNASDETDIEYNDEDIGEDHEDDDDKYLNQPLVPNETFNSKSNSWMNLALILNLFYQKFRFEKKSVKSLEFSCQSINISQF